jgi:hypothetical protein
VRTRKTFRILIFSGVGLLPIRNSAYSDVIHATETGRGEYEKGVFTPGRAEFRYRFDIDEKAGKAKLTEIIRLKNNEVIQQTVDYVITAAEDGTSLSSFLSSPARRKQKILTLVGKPGSLATEMILLGEDFFEYCKASAGRLYLATGTVKRSVSVEEDTSRQLQRR